MVRARFFGLMQYSLGKKNPQGPHPGTGHPVEILKIVLHSDVERIGLFDHGPVFSAVVQIIFQMGGQLPVAWVRYLLNERKTAWTRHTARL